MSPNNLSVARLRKKKTRTFARRTASGPIKWSILGVIIVYTKQALVTGYLYMLYRFFLNSTYFSFATFLALSSAEAIIP